MDDQPSEGSMTRTALLVSAGVVSLALFAGCPSRSLPPPPEDEPKHEATPACGKVFKDPKVRGGPGCCIDPAAGLLGSGDVISVCGTSAAAYLGETRDGTACRFHFQKPGDDPKQTFVMVSRLIVPSGAPAPMAPDPMLVWTWKKIPLQGALGYQATATGNEPGLLDHQTILWAGRGRRIVGLHVSKQVCNETQAQALLQKTIDAVP
jgi:hypothetical protein